MKRLLLAATIALPACVQQAPAPIASGPSLAVAFLAPLPGASFSVAVESDAGIGVVSVARSLDSQVISQSLVIDGAGNLGVVNGASVAVWRIGSGPGSHRLTVTATNAAGETASASRSITITP